MLNTTTMSPCRTSHRGNRPPIHFNNNNNDDTYSVIYIYYSTAFLQPNGFHINIVTDWFIEKLEIVLLAQRGIKRYSP